MELKINVNRKLGIVVFIVLSIVAVSSFAFFYTQKNLPFASKTTPPTKEPPRETRAELDLILADIRTVMLLTESETPTLVTVTEAERMRSQSFFKNTENGDKVIIYENAKKAILWRPSTKMIIEVGTVTKEKTSLEEKSNSKQSDTKNAKELKNSPTPTP